MSLAWIRSATRRTSRITTLIDTAIHRSSPSFSLMTSATSTRYASSFAGGDKPVALFLNASRLDYDRKLDFSKLEKLVDFRRNDEDYVTDPERLVSLVEEAQPSIVITKEMQVPAECLLKFPDTVKLMCEAGTGYNNLPLDAARARGMTVCNVPTYSTEAVAHMAITYILNLSINMFEQQSMLQDKDRSNFTGPFTLPLSEVNGKTLGLVGGSGRIGSKVGDIALALGMSLIISSRSGELPVGHRHGNNENVTVVKTSEIDADLLPQSDYVSLHMPLNDQTRRTFGKAQFESMKPSAFLVNTSRGGVCDEDALIAAVRDRTIAGAGLDVTTTEPPAMDSPIWTTPRIYLTPHIGWRRLETRQRLIDTTTDTIEAFLNASSPDEYENVVS